MDTIKMLIGHKIINITDNVYDGLLEIETDLAKFNFYHEYMCCENVWFESSDVPFSDLIGATILDASEYSGESKEEDNGDYLDFTFYSIKTNQYQFTLEFRGSSNGCYSTSVDMKIDYKQSGQFFEFDQNNSGGCWSNPALKVFVYARNSEIANELAHDIGIYFDGCENKHDCSCCGDRWYRAWNGMGYEKIKMFGEYFTDWGTSLPYYAIYYPQVNRMVNFYMENKIEVKGV